MTAARATRPPLRCQLVTPGSSARMIEKAAALRCDGLVLDLEDSVAPAMKAAAREVVRDALQTIDFGETEVAVRVNAVSTPWFGADVDALKDAKIDALVLSKAETVRDVHVADHVLERMERGRPMALYLLIESGAALERIADLVAASPRCAGVIFGAADFAASTGVAFNARGLAYARSRLAAAAAAAGVQALDHVHPQIDNAAGLEAEARHARDIGFTGKWAIHPRQAEIITRVFSPTPGEIEEAHRILHLNDAMLDAGKGAVADNGVLVDEAVIKIMRRRLAMAERPGGAE
jgi:citrate lyase subunit beta / citryl-CoA lyase